MKIIKVKKHTDLPKNYTGITEYSDGTKAWRLNGKLHRTDGPAIECSNGSKRWYLNGKLHRTDGPAFEWSDGTKQWCLNGKYLDPQKINQFTEEFGYSIEVAIKLVDYIDCKSIKDEI